MVGSKKTIIFQGFRGGPTFSRGVQMLISIETHIICDFPGWSGPPIPPLDPHMWLLSSIDPYHHHRRHHHHHFQLL